MEKEVVAFLNSTGGEIHIGVKDNGNVVGISNPDKTQLKIKDRLINNIRPSIMGLFDIFTQEKDGKTIIIVNVAGGAETPYYIKQKGRSEAGCFIRIGSSSQPMTEEMINRVQRKSLTRSLIQIEAPEQDLTFRQLLIHYSGNNKSLDENTFEKTLSLKNNKGKYNYLAYLLADDNKVPIRFARFDDASDRFELLEAKDYGNCCLLTAIQKIKDRFEVENITASHLTGAIQRIDKRLVDNKSLREIIVNAFAHNDYSFGMTPIFEVFQNRFSIRSYGGLVPELTKEEFFKGVSAYRNPELMRIFKDLGIVEGLGFGMRGIVKVYGKEIFEFTDNTLYANIPFDEEVMKSIKKVSGHNNNESSQKSSRKSSRKIIDVIKNNPQATIEEIAKAVGLSVAGTKKNISKLKTEEKLRRVGADKGGHWEIIE